MMMMKAEAQPPIRLLSLAAHSYSLPFGIGCTKNEECKNLRLIGASLTHPPPSLALVLSFSAQQSAVLCCCQAGCGRSRHFCRHYAAFLPLASTRHPRSCRAKQNGWKCQERQRRRQRKQRLAAAKNSWVLATAKTKSKESQAKWCEFAGQNEEAKNWG